MPQTGATNAGRRTRILIVEDDAELAARVAAHLAQHGHDAAVETRGDRAVERIAHEQPDLVVLDVMLPGKDGLTVCREVRRSFTGPILMLTARGGEMDEVVGLDVGADDYVAKPVRPRALLARIRALLRRPGAATALPAGGQERVEVGDLTIDPSTRDAVVGGVPLSLTSGEFDLLYLLASQAGRVLGRDEIFARLRGTNLDEFDRSIDLRVSRLRQKLGEAAPGGEVIKTIRGAGYLYVRS